MMVVDRNMQEQVKVIFNINFKTLSSSIKSALLAYELYRYQNARFNDKKKHFVCILCFLLGNSPASQFYMLTFRNTLPVPSS